LGVNPGRIKIFATPWSPPAWMKTQKNLTGKTGGSLRPECYNVYADYLIKYLKAYQQKGSPVYAMTVQNEPLNAPNYPGMLMNVNEQMNFIQNSLGPKLRANGLTTKIVGYDHNYDEDGVQYANSLLSNSNVSPFLAGIGFHTYVAPNYGALSDVHNRYNKDVWITEAGTGTWMGDGSITTQFQDQMLHLIRAPRNFGKGVLFWNIALDQVCVCVCQLF
jgi:glucosylceramidase